MWPLGVYYGAFVAVALLDPLSRRVLIWTGGQVFSASVLAVAKASRHVAKNAVGAGVRLVGERRRRLMPCSSIHDVGKDWVVIKSV